MASDFSATAKLKNALDPTSDLSSIDSDYENKDYRSAEAKLAKNPQLTILKQALIKGDSAKKEYEERQKMLSKSKKQANMANKGNYSSIGGSSVAIRYNLWHFDVQYFKIRLSSDYK